MRSTVGMYLHFDGDLRALGLTPSKLRAAVKRGDFIRVSPGAFLDAAQLNSTPHPAELRHVASTLAASTRVAGVVSGSSAANLYRLPLLKSRLAEPVTFTRATNGRTTAWVRIRRAEISPFEVTTRYGMQVTTLERTIRDLADFLPMHELLAATDAAMRQGFDPEVLPTSGRNAMKLRWLKANASDRAESFAESWSRFVMLQSGLPTPVLQISIYDEYGKFLGRVDFGWPEFGALGECDGLNKYDGKGLANGDPEGAIRKEKNREFGIVELGWELSR
ncbi:hypothetical protein EG850_02110 [Gulosibacter macacae]|uniref:AbiEi antitoxin C-terminal domain-containing protein n=1 Tax=Gulosibacter macacae TaxID=2488791 RepID=A0A3P3VZW1_9MICO|nr:hypothetical protein [Gulosibacter macacae]RRJ88260.1 hypothetical protein EG850_02110 [Gulosibacter macacae]